VLRTLQNLKTDWLYLPQDKAAAKNVKFDESKMARVSLPHTNVELPFHSFSEQEHCFVSWYRRHFKLPKNSRGRRVFIDFEGVMIAATVFVNGKRVGEEHRGGYTPFSVDITDLVDPRGDNVLAVRVDSTERKDIPPFGNVVDYLTFGGIYREVHLRVVDAVYIDHAFARPGGVLDDSKWLDVRARVVNSSREDATVDVAAVLQGVRGAKNHETMHVPAGQTVDVSVTLDNLAGVERWDLDAPRLYDLQVALSTGDRVETRVGFRTAEFRDDGFYLNDRHVKLRGLNRHQTYPYVGAAAPARLQRKDADILKHDLACNIVRTSHYPQSRHFLDRCDEIGLLVFEEIPGWQHIGDEAWKQLSLRDVEAMIVRDRNHPSIILWGVRINESKDDHDFYARTNALAHKLDPTRQTGGVRFLYDSELLEDVYTMNDFNYDLRPVKHPRWLHTEFCGHMYPVKTFDQEERVRQHVIHHAHVHNQIGGMRSAGGIGWCAFDYNTHLQFGSGDRICYHGVMDIFRQPKLAAHFYASQEDPAKRVVLEPISYWTMGDKSGAGVEPLLICSNCDEVEILVAGKSRGRIQPDRKQWPHLPHPPYVATGLSAGWGGDWEPLELRGYVNGKHVATKKISHDGQPARLIMAADDRAIDADGSDMTRVTLSIVDEFDNILPFAQQPVVLELTGPGVLVGENPFSMPGGRGAVYVRSTRKAGTITITATTSRLKPQKVTIKSVTPKEQS
jgi:beta-galactosidase